MRMLLEKLKTSFLDAVGLAAKILKRRTTLTAPMAHRARRDARSPTWDADALDVLGPIPHHKEGDADEAERAARHCLSVSVAGPPLVPVVPLR